MYGNNFAADCCSQFHCTELLQVNKAEEKGSFMF